MANPLEQIIALAKKGDRRVLLGGAVVVGGGVGLAVYLKNRNGGGGAGAGSSGGAGGNAGSSDMLGNPQAALAGSPDATSGGGGGGGPVDSPYGNSDLGLSLPTLPDVSSQPTAQTGGDQGLAGLPDLTASPMGNYGFGTSSYQPLPDLSSDFGSALPPLQPQSYAGDQSYGNDLGGLPSLPAFSPTLADASAPSASGASQPTPIAALANSDTSPVFAATRPTSPTSSGSKYLPTASPAPISPGALASFVAQPTQQQQQATQLLQSAYAQNLRLRDTVVAEFASQAYQQQGKFSPTQSPVNALAQAYQQNNNLLQSQYQEGRIPSQQTKRQLFNQQFQQYQQQNKPFWETQPTETPVGQSAFAQLGAYANQYQFNPAYSQNAALAQTVASQYAPQAQQLAAAYQQNANLASSMQQSGRIPQQQQAIQQLQAAAAQSQPVTASRVRKVGT